ncbi:Superoxide dismutase [Mn], mitochondrial [Mortierella sp. GBA35]|nr:Superoxide dismutase [Mn], mitochondrial [Mortierella sp. AD031]KAF9103574.1 Superoxide dismutase [Mn], mitochondrial [Mortierella sp. GBA35]KAG0216431.1 Superoxide dismutase [Mn], mitochondrial [Mortierella sp. NVP41]
MLRSIPRTFAAINKPSAFAGLRYKHTLPALPYAYEALEPYISGEIMKIHHAKHHQTYINNLNAAEEKLGSAFKGADVTEEIAIQSAIKFNGGGHINHTLFWENLTPGNKEVPKPSGELLKEIEKTWGSFDNFVSKFNTQTAAVQGSGWGWLGYNKEFKRLEIATTGNQDPLKPTTGLIPLLGVDVWEHAYYLQYKNVRPDYLNAIWHVINWKTVTDRFNKAQK